MASTLHVVYGAAVGLAFWTLLGFLVARRVVAPGLAWPFAPALGWAVHNVVALPVFFVVPFDAPRIALVGVAIAGLWFFVARRRDSPVDVDDGARVPPWTLILAALLACVSAAAILPKGSGATIALADPIFDHAKVALVDEIARLGVPPGNPFIGGDAGDGRLAYYYLWHFSAGALSRLLGISGWEADAAMTFVAAFTSLVTMMGLAVRVSGRPAAAGWVVAFAASASARFLLVSAFGEPGLDAWIQNPGGFAGWLFQSAWVPQHLAATSCVLVAVYLTTRLATRVDVATIVVAALAVAAGFESSTWIGGVAFALAMIVVVPTLFVTTARAARVPMLIALAAVGVTAVVVAFPFIHDQMAAAALRNSGPPVALHPFPILGERIATPIRGLLDLPAYWLVLLPIELVAIYLPGLAALRGLLRRNDGPRRLVACYAALGLAALMVGGLFASTLADNNDLAWRAALLASTVLIVFAAAGFSTWIAARRWRAVVAVSCALALGAPEAIRLAAGNVGGHPQPDAERFAAAPALWDAVRRHAGPAERVANNPQSLEHMTPWAVNIGWSLLADRRSCYATWELTQVYTSLPHDRLRAIDRRFVRVFAGDATDDDVRALATTYDCSVVVLTPEDGAWKRDPFATSGVYALVDDEAGRWRIYRRR